MGLDMFAYLVKAELTDDRVVDASVEVLVAKSKNFEVLTNESAEGMTAEQRTAYWDAFRAMMADAQETGLVDKKFAYWRKFNHLHGFMESLYREKGGTEEFNCTTVRVCPEDLDALEAAAGSLKPSTGFFFGSQQAMMSEDLEEIQSFVTRSRAAIAAGYAIFYDSWW